MSNRKLCPRCADQVPLVEREYGAERVDFCLNCHGIYFDKGELEGLVQIMSDFNSVKLDEPELENQPSSEKNFTPNCPNCQEAMPTDQVGQVWINQCSACGGIWLDQGELSALKGTQLIIRDNLSLFIRLGQ